MAYAAAAGVCAAYLPVFGNYLALAAGHPGLGNSFFFINYRSLRVSIRLFNAIGFESVWMPHPLALIASAGFVVAFYSLLAYVVLRLWAKIKTPPLP